MNVASKVMVAAITLVGAHAGCGGNTASSDSGAGGAAGADAGSAGGATGGTGGAGGSGGASTGGTSGGGTGGGAGTGGIDCSNVGCAAAPVCGTGCMQVCGCCGCPEGEIQNIDGMPHRCSGDCWEPVVDAGAMGCADDRGCPNGFWCRPECGNGMGSTCVPFAAEGEFCGGLTPPCGESRCAPPSICTDVPLIPDAPGRCRVPCASNRECPDERYCSPNNDVCRDDGSCLDTFDCQAPGNDYPVDLCLGFPHCNGGTCEWQCGNENCPELSGYEFGFCDLPLGVGIIDGSCTPISGCDGQGVTFFGSMGECQAECS